ncbi:MAG: sigma-70 family RNA polymerase sigma factor [Sporichthyaceae bacterium]|nr:sigma-70 family RNA polymerase sigma factor [Sporichthyaceae bacterium]
MPEPSDEDLLLAIAAGPGALAEFYRRHVGRIVGFGVRRFADPEDVADFVADVFVEVLAGAYRFDPRRGSALGWLYGLAGNIAAASLRRQARAGAAVRRLSGRAALDADDYDRVEAQIDAAAELRATYRALLGLPETDRRLLELVAVDGLGPAAVAEAAGLSAVTVRVRLARARQRLRTVLATTPDRPDATNHGTNRGTDPTTHHRTSPATHHAPATSEGLR